MSKFFFLFGNLLGAINGKIGALFLGVATLVLISLLIFAGFFLFGDTSRASDSPALAPGELVVYLSPQLSSDDVQSLYREIREMPQTEEVNYRFAQDLGLDQAGGVFIVQAASASAARAIQQSVSPLPGVTNIDSFTQEQADGVSLSRSLWIGLLIGLIVSVTASLALARHSFSLLLESFSAEIRLLRLSGTPSWVFQGPVVALGVLCGVLAAMLLVVIVYLFHFFVVSNPQAAVNAARGLLQPERVILVSLLGSLVGVILGALIGILGASLTSKERFQVYS
jgi:cell division protein FtsX